jgi:vacuolar-type H+-ATPase subunit E/Vma4
LAEAEKISNQIISSAKLEARFCILQEKRKGIDGILKEVRAELSSMKPSERASFIENTVAGLKILGGKYELDCAERDLEQIEKKRLDEISKEISADGEPVIIKKGSAIPISGGFILRSKTADYDFSMESILRSRQGEIEAEVVKSLFGEAPKKNQE